MKARDIIHRTEYRIRYSDTDKMGVVYYGNYMRLFEIGRTELLRSAGLPYADLEREGYLLPVLEAHAEYHEPARYDEVIVIETRYTPERTPILVLRYELFRDDRTLATGWTRHSFVSASAFKPVRPPKRFFEAMDTYHHIVDA
jgi:acyl-CoA thioester hydrolase